MAYLLICETVFETMEPISHELIEVSNLDEATVALDKDLSDTSSDEFHSEVMYEWENSDKVEKSPIVHIRNGRKSGYLFMYLPD